MSTSQLDGFAVHIKNSRGRAAFHGLSLNVDMDLAPGQRINPCGYAELLMTQIKARTDDPAALNMETLEAGLVKHFCQYLNFKDAHWIDEPTSVLTEAS